MAWGMRIELNTHVTLDINWLGIITWPVCMESGSAQHRTVTQASITLVCMESGSAQHRTVTQASMGRHNTVLWSRQVWEVGRHNTVLWPRQVSHGKWVGATPYCDPGKYHIFVQHRTTPYNTQYHMETGSAQHHTVINRNCEQPFSPLRDLSFLFRSGRGHLLVGARSLGAIKGDPDKK